MGIKYIGVSYYRKTNLERGGALSLIPPWSGSSSNNSASWSVLFLRRHTIIISNLWINNNMLFYWFLVTFIIFNVAERLLCSRFYRLCYKQCCKQSFPSSRSVFLSVRQKKKTTEKKLESAFSQLNTYWAMHTTDTRDSFRKTFNTFSV